MQELFRRNLLFLLVTATVLINWGCSSPEPVRLSFSLNNDWQTFATDSAGFQLNGFQNNEFSPQGWVDVDVPHNWDDYGGYRRLVHGNFHGTAWYRKHFKIEKPEGEKRFFLYFEGVGSYATVYLNGNLAGYHEGGRTTFTLDVTEFVRFDSENLLAVRADHPAEIRDLPWVCGGCSSEWGFSEGSQPLGIFRPVHLIVTNPVRVEPFGVHIWNDDKVSEESAILNLTAEIKNYGAEPRAVEVKNILKDHKGKTVAKSNALLNIQPGKVDTLALVLPEIKNPRLWSLDDPYRYRLHTQVWEKGKLTDELVTPYGIRWTKWDIFGENATNRFYLNGKPIFINGTAEYEHLMGQSHAFSDEQVLARVQQIKAMGFNAFRDAHQPHNFRYHEVWDSVGVLWWPQFSAHIWFDNEGFKDNFKQLMHNWIKERRNSPSIILWGLQNESTLPDWFSIECTEMVRQLDPGSPSQRLVATCNGGAGTDWNVPQNWSGTYGGNPYIYDEELSRQLLNAEYGAWRSADLHTEGEFEQNGPYSEDRMCLLMETKVRLGEKVSDRVCGQFHWLFNSHDNPGRRQGGEGMRELDRVGPVNYKGTISIWGEPVDPFYMYRSHYAPKETEPMVYIASHSWPHRWTEPGIKDGIRIYSNCDEVELYNGVKANLLGRQKRGPIGTHFVFDQVDIQNNILYAIGYVNGKAVATDYLMLHHLPQAVEIKKLAGKTQPLTTSNRSYLYRVNCGGPDYTDADGKLWMADVYQSSDEFWGSRSWTDDYPGLPAFFASQRQTFDPIEGTLEWPLIQTFRYGRHKLQYRFPVPDGDYHIELFFVEPWYGTGGGLKCKNWRLFDVAVNNKTVIDDLDIWAEVGHDKVLKKEVKATVKGGMLEISFPQVKSGQAVISAIAISSNKQDAKPAPPAPRLLQKLQTADDSQNFALATWMNTGDAQYTQGKGAFVKLAPVLYGAEWVKMPETVAVNAGNPIASFTLNADAELFVGIDDKMEALPEWLATFVALDETITSTANGFSTYKLYKKLVSKGETVALLPIITDGNNSTYPVAVVPITGLDDALDLRPTVSHQAEDGVLKGSARVTEFFGKTCVIIPDEKGTYGLEFSVGLASKYGLEFRFMNMGSEELPVHALILSDDNRVMWEGEWTFRVADVKWQSMRTDTQTTINAGTYTILITPKAKGPLYIDWVRVQ